jgi:hypothetical protein
MARLVDTREGESLTLRRIVALGMPAQVPGEHRFEVNQYSRHYLRLSLRHLALQTVDSDRCFVTTRAQDNPWPSEYMIE